MNARSKFCAKACLLSAMTGMVWGVPSVGQAQGFVPHAGAKIGQAAPGKKTAAKPSPVVQAAGVRPAAAIGAPQAAPVAPGQSAVQARLEELYRQNGREMPPMNLEEMQFEQTAARNVPPGRNAPNAPQSQGQVQVAANRPSLLQRLIPGRSRTPQPQPPKEPRENAQFVTPRTAPPVAAQNPLPAQYKPAPVTPTKPGLLPGIAPAEPVEAQPTVTAEPTLLNESGADVRVADKLDDLNLDKPVSEPLPPAPEEPITITPAETPFSGLTISTNEAEQPAPAPTAKRTIPDEAPIEPKLEPEPKAETEVKVQPEVKVEAEQKPGAEIKQEPEAKPAPQVVAEPPVAAAPQIPEPQDERSRQLRMLAARRDLKGLKGFCIVALKDKRQLIEAHHSYLSVHKAQVYSFSSAAAKAAFDADPEAYAPVHSGNDVVRLAAGNAAVEGSLDHAVWYKGRLFLFSSAASRELFIESPAKFVPKD